LFVIVTAVSSEPIIIEAAINGAGSKERNPHVPNTPDEISADALRCLAAGAAIVHNHIDLLAVDGQKAAARYLEGWLPVVNARPDALLYPTSNFGATVEESYAHLTPLVEAGALRIGVCDAGSVNLGRFVYVNSRRDIDYQLALCRRLALGPSMAIFEPGFLRTAVSYWRAGKVPSGAMVKLYFASDHGYLGDSPFGLPPTALSLDVYLALLEGCDLPWSAAVIGGDVFEAGFARQVMERGGHLHVGLEDHFGSDQPTNEELVAQATDVAASVGRPVASCSEAAALLGLPSRP
jgi:uncharacterized protein (DUF849 family)